MDSQPVVTAESKRGDDSTLRILCVDQDHTTLTLTSGILQRQGFQVIQARDGRQALAAAVRYKPHLIILDVLLPDINGYDLIERLKEHAETANTCVIIFTARGDVEGDTDESWRFANRVQDRLKGFDSGALEYVNKPVTARELVRRVKAALWASGYAV